MAVAQAGSCEGGLASSALEHIVREGGTTEPPSPTKDRPAVRQAGVAAARSRLGLRRPGGRFPLAPEDQGRPVQERPADDQDARRVRSVVRLYDRRLQREGQLGHGRRRARRGDRRLGRRQGRLADQELLGRGLGTGEGLRLDRLQQQPDRPAYGLGDGAEHVLHRAELRPGQGAGAAQPGDPEGAAPPRSGDIDGPASIKK